MLKKQDHTKRELEIMHRLIQKEWDYQTKRREYEGLLKHFIDSQNYIKELEEFITVFIEGKRKEIKEKKKIKNGDQKTS